METAAFFSPATTITTTNVTPPEINQKYLLILAEVKVCDETNQRFEMYHAELI